MVWILELATAVTPDYRIERWETRTWFRAKRYGWRIRARNGQIVASSGAQLHTRMIDRDGAMLNFARACNLPGAVALVTDGAHAE